MIYHSNNLISTEKIIGSCNYITDLKEFYRPAWKSVLSQVLKLETKQTYVEKGNPSYELMIDGKFNEAIEIIPTLREGDLKLYQDLTSRKVDFIRCRPIIFPMTQYLKWEIEAYKFNSKYCEKIYFVEYTKAKSIFENLALHDYIVFDYDKALILDYDVHGSIRGGWIVSDEIHLMNLIQIFSIIRAFSVEFSVFLANHSE